MTRSSSRRNNSSSKKRDDSNSVEETQNQLLSKPSSKERKRPLEGNWGWVFFNFFSLKVEA